MRTRQHPVIGVTRIVKKSRLLDVPETPSNNKKCLPMDTTAIHLQGPGAGAAETVLDQILIVDDHPFFADGLGGILLRHRLASRVDRASTVEEAIEILGRVSATDLVLLDLRLPGEGGLALLPRLDRAGLPIPVVAISSAEDEVTVRAARAAGVQGFMPKSADAGMLSRMIRTIARGDTWFPGSESITEPTARLTPRQQEVLALLAKGFPNKRICQELALTEHTVKTHLKAVFELLGVHNRTECVTRARALGLVDSGGVGPRQPLQDRP